MVCKKYGMWLNVDAAYLGSTWLCPEFRDTMRGVEFADSVMLNFSKMGFTGVGGSLFFVGDKL
jgi:glutamate/tyrosine decarboxylase-like PLP-dependent enzyme